MKNERQAYFALASTDCGFRGSLGPKREAHKRPSLLSKIARRFADVFLAKGQA